MDTFLELNSNKLKPVFIRLLLAFLAFVSIALSIAALTGHFPNLQLVLAIILTAGIGFPLFIMLLGYMIWLLNRNAKQRMFSKIPFNQVADIGFYKSYIDQRSRWAFTEEIKEGKINGFTLRMGLAKDKGHSIEFDTQTEWKKLDKIEYRRLTENFRQHGIEFKIGSLVRVYDTKQTSLKSVSDLKLDLELFTTLLIQEGFEPKS